jgi:hypothetical protein
MTTRGGIQSTIHVLVFALTALLTLVGPLVAQPARAAAVTGVLPEASPDSLLILLPPRAVDVVRQDLAIADALESTASQDMIAAQGRLGEAKAHVDVRKSEIEMIKAKVKLAKEQKNETEQANLELQVKAKELQLKMIEARRDMRDVEASLAETRRKAAQTQSSFFKKEIELIGKRADLTRMTSAPEGVTNLDGLVRIQGEIRDLERRCLEIAKDVADKEKSVAESEANLLDRRMKVYEAQLAFLAGPKK